MTARLSLILALAAACLVLRVGAIVAEPLPKEECDKLKTEQAELNAAGVRDQLARGADWGKVNLSMQQMQRVQRYIAVDEQLSFRCGLAKLRTTLPVAEEGGEQELDEKGQPIPPKPKDAGAAAAHPKPRIVRHPHHKSAKPSHQAGTGADPAAGNAKAKPAAKAPAQMKADAGAEAPTAARAQPKAKARPKTDDAYRPAAKGTGAGAPGSQPPANKQ